MTHTQRDIIRSINNSQQLSEHFRLRRTIHSNLHVSCVSCLYTTHSHIYVYFLFFLLWTRKKEPVFKYLFRSSAVLLFTLELQTEANAQKQY
jgi:hypothetical protein